MNEEREPEELLVREPTQSQPARPAVDAVRSESTGAPQAASDPEGYPWALEVEQLRYRVKEHFWSPWRQILKNVTLRARRGTIFGFLGPNGAGKTTTLKAVIGLLQPHGGQIRLGGRPVADPAARRGLGFMPERPYFPTYLSGRELLVQHGLLVGHSWRAARRQAQEILDLAGLSEAAGKPLGTYSKGMLQRVGLAQALVGEPAMVILDEPMSGLDPLGRRLVRDILLRLQERGKTVLFSTHILPDVESLCDDIAIIVHGVVRRSGRVEELLGGQMLGIDITSSAVDEPMVQRAALLSRAVQRHPWGHTFEVADEQAAGQVIDLLRSQGACIRSVQTNRGSLEDLFLQETLGASSSTVPVESLAAAAQRPTER